MSKQKKLTFKGQPASLIGLALEHDIPYSTLNRKWAEAGRPDEITEDLLEAVNRCRRPHGKRVGNVQILERRRPLSRLYSDSNYLPHIPFGDLAHLSDERNTGAARDKLHEVYRCPLSTT